MEDATEFDIVLILHIGILLWFVVFGGFENFVVIFLLHKKKKLQSGQKFMLCLAYVDFFYCVYCVPMIPVNIYLHVHERFASDAEAMFGHHVSLCRVLRSSHHAHHTGPAIQPELPLLSEPRRQPRHLLHDQQGLLSITALLTS